MAIWLSFFLWVFCVFVTPLFEFVWSAILDWGIGFSMKEMVIQVFDGLRGMFLSVTCSLKPLRFSDAPILYFFWELIFWVGLP